MPFLRSGSICKIICFRVFTTQTLEHENLITLQYTRVISQAYLPGDVVKSKNGRLMRRQHTHDLSSGLWHSHRFSGTCFESAGSPLLCWITPSRPVHSRSATIQNKFVVLYSYHFNIVFDSLSIQFSTAESLDDCLCTIVALKFPDQYVHSPVMLYSKGCRPNREIYTFIKRETQRL